MDKKNVEMAEFFLKEHQDLVPTITELMDDRLNRTVEYDWHEDAKRILITGKTHVFNFRDNIS